MRAETRALIAAMAPGDAAEAADLRYVLDWIDSGARIWREGGAADPPVHLVAYVAPVDFARETLLLVDHRKAGLWLPPGGHIEPGEAAESTAAREAEEELGMDVRGHLRGPLLLTVTRTVGAGPRHTDVSLWFAAAVDEHAPVRIDAGEFAAARWYAWNGLPGSRRGMNVDPFVARLAGAAPDGHEEAT
ncbi:MAG: NUDIX domain-containing protein [Dehalococcoidia bacterium]|nr:NUDIX domain-containing protein [Dehalococcoidia bacterium]